MPTPAARGTRLTVINYTPTEFEEREVSSPEACDHYVRAPGLTWVNVSGLEETATVAHIATCFGAHPLIVEDVLQTDQRPKLDFELEKYLFLVMWMLQYDAARKDIIAEQVSLLLNGRSVVSFQEEKQLGDVFDAVRRRLRNNEGPIRQAGPDYLAYALLDAVVDNYFGVVERLGERVEEVEEELISHPDQGTLQHIYELRRQLLLLRRAIWPLREVVGELQRGTSPLIAPSTLIYLRDLHDHIFQVMDTVETLREMVAGMIDIYLSSVSNRLNEVMKVLTIIATIFIPLTFIAGWYGMNFENMPELSARWGYPAVFAVSVVVAVTMLVYFRRRRWL